MPENDNPRYEDQPAFEIYRLLYDRGYLGTPIQSLSQRLRSLQKGLSAEAEFAATVAWLGNCQAIFKIETNSATVRAESKLRAPDFIAFPIVDGRAIPTLIEVKSPKGQQIKWSATYFSSLTQFANSVKLPLLIAWNYKGVWLLVDHSHFEKNVTGYRLTLETAFKEDLMCLLFRDLKLSLNPALQMFVDLEILDEFQMSNTDEIPNEFKAKIINVGYSHDGIELKRNGREYLHLFLSAPDESDVIRIDSRTVRQVFRPMAKTVFSLSRAFIAEMSLDNPGNLDWNDVLRRAPFPSSGANYRQILPQAIEDGVLLHVWDIAPSTTPEFLNSRSQVRI